MRATWTTAGGLLLIFLLAGPALAAETWRTPAWSVGDQWDYFGASRDPPERGGARHAYLAKILVVGREPVVTSEGTVDAFKVAEMGFALPDYASESQAPTGPVKFTSVGLKWFRPDDLAILQQAIWDVSDPDEPRPANVGLRWAPPCAVYGLPLEEGVLKQASCWSIEMDAEAGDPPRETQTVSTARLEGKERVETPAGAFDAYRVVVGVDGRDSERQWYADEACWRVRLEGISATANATLLGYRCGDRTGGNLTTVDPSLRLESLGIPPPRDAPAPSLVLALAGVALAAWVARRRV